MSGEAQVLSLAEAVADGADIDWDHAESSAAGPEERRVIAELRQLATLGSIARAQARIWGSLEIRGEVGRGTFGTVYRAWDPHLEREVALKLLHDKTAGAAAIREGRLLAQIRHLNVVTVLGADAFDGIVGVWMEFITGRTLREIVASHGPLGAHEAAIVGRDLCRALAAVHRCGFLHGDVKAQNVMREAGGRTLLMDFGASHAVTVGTDTVLAGTPAYLAPELLSGGVPTVQSDLYSLGVLLYFLVTGSFPVVGSSLDEFRQLHEAGLRTSLRDTRPDVPAVFIRAVEQATAVEPSERPATAGALEVLLDAALKDVTTSEEHRAAGSSNYPGRRIAWIIAASIALAGAGALGWRWTTAKNDDSVMAGIPRQITFAPGLEAQPALSPDGRLIAYSSNESGAAHIWISDVNGGNPVQITDGRGRETHPAWFPDGSAIAYVLSEAAHESIWKTPPLGGSTTLLVDDGTDPAVSPDGMLIAFARGRAFYRIAVAPLLDTGQARLVTGDEDGLWNHRSPSWSPDGRTIAYAAQNALWLVHPNGGRPVRLTTDAQADRDPVWSADGRYLYFSSIRQGTEAIWRIPIRGGPPERVTMGTGPERQPSTSLDGKRIAYSTQSSGSDVALLSLRTGREWRLPSVRDEEMPSFAPDQSALAFVSNRWNGRSDLWIQPLVNGGVAKGSPRRVTEQGSANYPAFSPDGKWLAYGRIVGERRDIWIITADGGAPVRLTNDALSHFHPAWSPDGTRLAYVAGAAAHYRIESVPIENGRAAGVPVLVYEGTDLPLSPGWSPDGRSLAFVRADEVWIANVTATTKPRQITNGAGARRLRWKSRSGRLFVSGFWGTNQASVRSLDVRSGTTSRLPVNVVIGDNDNYIDFDMSSDETYAAVVKEDVRGDVWVIERPSGH